MTYNRVLLSDAFWFQEGPGVRKWQFQSSGIKLLNVANILKEGRIDLSKTDRYLADEEVNAKYSHFLADEGDLVIASSGVSIDDDGLLRTRGAFVEPSHLPLCMNTSTIRFKAKPTISNLAFLKHWLQSDEFRKQITREVTGIAQKNFGPSHLKRISVSLPPLDEQKRIAAILDTADEMRAKRRQSIAELDKLLQSVFLDMFGDPVTNPKGWQVRPLGELISSGPSNGVSKKPEFLGQGVPLIDNKAIYRGVKADLTNMRQVMLSADEKLRFAVRQGDLLFNRVSVKPEGVGMSVWIENPSEDCVHESNTMRVTLKPELHHIFAVFCLRTESMRQATVASANIANQASINQQGIKSLRMICPPLETQRKFATIVKATESQRCLSLEQLAELNTLFASLQQRAFSGELSLNKEPVPA